MSEYVRVVELWKSWKITTEADLDKYLHNFRILFAYHSGRIENDEITWHDTREIFENGRVTGFTGSPRAIFEQQNQRLCYEYMKEKIINRAPIDLDLIKEVHRILTSGTYEERRYIENKERPGEFKKHDYVIGLYEVGSAPEDVEGELAELIAEIGEYSGADILKSAAYFHGKFEFIHPFADGNGRVGRALLNYYLMIKGHPPLIIKDEEKGKYYKALQMYDEKEELTLLYEFLKNAAVQTWAKALALADGEKQERKPLSDFIGEGK